MKVKVKLFGTLGQRFPGYRLEEGIDVQIPDGSSVKDLLAHLRISDSQKGVVAVDGLVIKGDERLTEGSSIHVFQPVFGG